MKVDTDNMTATDLKNLIQDLADKKYIRDTQCENLKEVIVPSSRFYDRAKNWIELKKGIYMIADALTDNYTDVPTKRMNMRRRNKGVPDKILDEYIAICNDLMDAVDRHIVS